MNASDLIKPWCAKQSMSESKLQKTWRDAVPFITWAVLIFGFGAECVAESIRANWIKSIAAFAGVLVLIAMALYWKSAEQTLGSVWLTPAIMVLLVALTLSPPVVDDQLRSPSRLVSPHAFNTEVVEIQRLQALTLELQRQLTDTDTKIATLQSASDEAAKELANAKRALEDARKELDAVEKSVSTQSPLPVGSQQLATSYQVPESQVRELADALSKIKDLLPKSIDIQRIMYDSDAMGLSTQIGRAFDLAGIAPVYHWNRPLAPQEKGMRIRIADDQRIPDAAIKIAQAFKNILGANSVFEIEKNQDRNSFYLFVGPKP